MITAPREDRVHVDLPVIILLPYGEGHPRRKRTKNRAETKSKLGGKLGEGDV